MSWRIVEAPGRCRVGNVEREIKKYQKKTMEKITGGANRAIVWLSFRAQ